MEEKMKARTIFKILGILIILMAGLIFLFYSWANQDFVEAEKAYKHGDFDGAQLFYEKGLERFDKLSFFKISFLNKNANKIKEKLEDVSRLARAWSVYYQGYYDSEKYKLAEETVNQELKNNSDRKDQFYNLKALICWQKGVDLFIELGKKAINSKELDQLIEEAKTNSGEAVKSNDGNDRDIKYNYEFFRLPKDKLKQNMQQAAQQKMQDREMKKKGEQMAKDKNIKPNKQNGQQQDQEKKVDKNKDNMKNLVPIGKKEKDKATKESNADTPKKKKKKG